MNIVKRSPLPTKELILSKIDSWDIYSMYLPELKIHRKILSPFRKEDNPSFSVFMAQDGNFRHIDFSSPEYSGDCFEFVGSLFNLDFTGTLNKIAIDFGIIAGEGLGTRIQLKASNKPLNSLKRHCFIQVYAKPFTLTGLSFWNQYEITESDLREHDIYQVREVFVNRKKKPLKKDEIVFAYYYKDGFKIYFCERSKDEGKWISNVPLDYPRGVENINIDKNTLIVKSLKEYIICRKILDEVVQVQNESIGSVTPKLADLLILGSKKVFYGGDADLAGKEASIKICSKYGFQHINPPDRYLEQGGKDWADLVLLEDIDSVKKHFKQKGLI